MLHLSDVRQNGIKDDIIVYKLVMRQSLRRKKIWLSMMS